MKVFETIATNQTISAPQQAQRYFDAGMCPVPNKPRTKEPVESGWPTTRFSRDDLATKFQEGINIGIILGDASGLVDIDLDSLGAIALAPYFLPPTDFIFGRSSKPASHRIYRVPSSGKTRQFTANTTGMIVELRASGSQTIFPGSIHESGELIEFTDWSGEGLPTPAEATYDALLKAATDIAIATVLLQHWNPGKRHHLALAVAGFLAKKEWPQQRVNRLITAVAECGQDAEIHGRIENIKTTFENLSNGDLISGRIALADLIGSDDIKDIDKWIGSNVSLLVSSPVAANSNIQWSIPNLETDDDMALTFAQHNRRVLRYCAETRQWYQRDVEVFEPVADATVQGRVSDFAQTAHKNLGQLENFPKAIKSRGRINAAVELSRSRLPITPDKIDDQKHLIGLKDGQILDLETKDYVFGDQAFVTKRLGTVFDPEAECPRWLQFLDRCFDGNQEVIDFIQRAVGYSLSGSTSEQCLFILIGKGANGKSTLLNTLGGLCGDYSGVTPMQTLMVMPFSNGQTNDLAALVGKRFVAASDGETTQALAEAKIKNMTGGDSITCRGLYKDYITYQPQFKLWVATNDLPKVSGSDDAIWRKINIIDFPVVIPPDERDPNLQTALAAELAGILNWALIGYDFWRSGGLSAPAAVKNATKSYRHENDVVGRFIDECCLCNPDARELVRDLYGRYEKWVEENGGDVMFKEQFGKILGKKGFQRKNMRSGNGYVGLQLKPEPDDC